MAEEKQTKTVIEGDLKNINADDLAVDVHISEDATIKGEPLVASELVPQGEKLLATLGYFGFLCVLPIALKPKSKLCQLHGKQAMVIAIVFLIFSWLTILSVWFGVLLFLLHVGISVWGMLNAWRGKEESMPFIGDIAKNLKW